MRKRSASQLVRVFILLIAALALAAAPAVAQEDGGDEEGSEAGVTCDPENPEAGSTTDCEATGLMGGSPFEWTAEFTDGSTEEGQGTADFDGVGTFTVQIPDSAPIGGYQVTVTGKDAEGEDYEESHEGLIVPGGGEDDGGDDGGEDAGDEGDDQGDDGQADDDFGEEEGEAGFTGSDDTPQGGVATGAGGTADGSPLVPILVALLAVGAVIGTVLYRRRGATGTG